MNSRSLSVEMSRVSEFVYGALGFITLYANLLLTFVIKCKKNWLEGTCMRYDWWESNLKD